MKEGIKEKIIRFFTCSSKVKKDEENESIPTCTRLGKNTSIITKNRLQDSVDFLALFNTGKRISNGAYGIVNKLKKPLDEVHETALKAILFEDYRNDQKTLLKEAHYQRLLNDSGFTPKLISCSFNNKMAFIAQEYIDGTTLLDKRAQNALTRSTPSQKFSAFMLIFKAIALMAQLNFVHNDIKPENIMITYQNIPSPTRSDPSRVLEVPKQLYLIDFGFASKADTEPEFFMGTPYYLSDDRIALKNFKPIDDVYALALSVAVALSSTERIFGSLETACFKKEMTPDCKSYIRKNAKGVFEGAGFGNYDATATDISKMNLTTLLLSIIQYNPYKNSFREIMQALERLEVKMSPPKESEPAATDAQVIVPIRQQRRTLKVYPTQKPERQLVL